MKHTLVDWLICWDLYYLIIFGDYDKPSDWETETHFTTSIARIWRRYGNQWQILRQAAASKRPKVRYQMGAVCSLKNRVPQNIPLINVYHHISQISVLRPA